MYTLLTYMHVCINLGNVIITSDIEIDMFIIVVIDDKYLLHTCQLLFGL